MDDMVAELAGLCRVHKYECSAFERNQFFQPIAVESLVPLYTAASLFLIDGLGTAKAVITTSSCISVLTNSAVIVFNLVFMLHTFYHYCNASRSGFVYRGH